MRTIDQPEVVNPPPPQSAAQRLVRALVVGLLVALAFVIIVWLVWGSLSISVTWSVFKDAHAELSRRTGIHPDIIKGILVFCAFPYMLAIDRAISLRGDRRGRLQAMGFLFACSGVYFITLGVLARPFTPEGDVTQWICTHDLGMHWVYNPGTCTEHGVPVVAPTAEAVTTMAQLEKGIQPRPVTWSADMERTATIERRALWYVRLRDGSIALHDAPGHVGEQRLLRATPEILREVSDSWHASQERARRTDGDLIGQQQASRLVTEHAQYADLAIVLFEEPDGGRHDLASRIERRLLDHRVNGTTKAFSHRFHAENGPSRLFTSDELLVDELRQAGRPRRACVGRCAGRVSPAEEGLVRSEMTMKLVHLDFARSAASEEMEFRAMAVDVDAERASDSAADRIAERAAEWLATVQ